jgi:hypothetical protein
MWIAGQLGIKVFATGGIGGVHRCAESSKLFCVYFFYLANVMNNIAFDVSADLTGKCT